MRTIKEIQEQAISSLKSLTTLKLSTSAVAEWRLWTYVTAGAIHAFEIILDMFRQEIDTLTNKITPGTVRWYAEMCYRFQDKHELLFDEKTAMLYYAKDDEAARIVKIVAISEKQNSLLIKAAKIDNTGKIIPLTLEEKYNFTAYIDAIKFAGVQTDVISTTEDKIRYRLQVWFDPAMPNTLVRENIVKALDEFKAAQGFDSMIYSQKLVDAVMATSGVITCKLVSLERKGTSDADFKAIDVFSELESGYFEYADDSTLELNSIKDLKA